MIVDRPLVNLSLVIAGFLVMTISGLGEGISSRGVLSYYPLWFFGFGLALVLMLPLLFWFAILGDRKRRILSVIGLVVGLWLALSGQGLFVGNSEISISFSVQSFILIFLALGLTSLGAIWCEKLPLVILSAIPILILALFAGAGMMVKMGLSVMADTYAPSFAVPAVALLVFGVSAGAVTALTIGLKYMAAFGIGRQPRDSASEAVNNSLTFVMFSICTGMSMAIAGTFLSDDIALVTAITGAQPLFGLCVSAFASLGILMILPGFLWLMEKQKPLLNDIKEITSNHKNFEPPGFSILWKQTRKLLPIPSAYGLVFIVAIVCVVLTVGVPTRPDGAEILFTLLIIGISGICFLSLRVLVITGVLLTMSMIIAVSLMNAGVGDQLHTMDRLAAIALASILLADVMLRFRDLSVIEKRSRAVVAKITKKASGPYLLFSGTILTILVMADTANFWVSAGNIGVHFVIMAAVMFFLLPAVVTILSSRYGKF